LICCAIFARCQLFLAQLQLHGRAEKGNFRACLEITRRSSKINLTGFLPCGLVYVACAVLSGVNYMLAFGLGTLPMMLSIGLMGKLIQAGIRLRFQKMIPACLVILGLSLILRGISLGIPYLSPTLTSHGIHCPACFLGGR
jgi:sulfite exporter TauE/SafE